MKFSWKNPGALILNQGALFVFLTGCASTVERPIKPMIYASAAMKAAERSQAEKRSPDYYRRAENSYWKASRMFLAKEYLDAGKAANDARRLAEMAEVDSEIRASQVTGDDE